MRTIAGFVALLAAVAAVCAANGPVSGQRRLNNLVTELLEVSPVSEPSQPFGFAHSTGGWIWVSFSGRGKAGARVLLDQAPAPTDVMVQKGETGFHGEAMRLVTQGEHHIKVECPAGARLEKLEVRAIPELVHCGLGFNPAIKSYGVYDLAFLSNDILPNVTTLIVPSGLSLPTAQVEDWRGQGKRFVGEVGIDPQAKTPEEHFKYWTGFFERNPALDGVIIDEFIVNRPIAEWIEHLTPERAARFDEERQQYEAYSQAILKLRADERFRSKTLYAYVGGSGKKYNQEIVGTNCIHALITSGYRIALERYLHEMSSEKGSQDALQTFVDGIADWEAKEPGVEKHMVIAFGLFSMPPGGINKQPNVDYHVWMDQQMNRVANEPRLAGIAGLEWWTSSLADEETVRFVGRLYRHYGIEGRKDLLTHDPLFLTHIQNADFEKGTQDWTLHAAEEGNIAAKSFPRYGRIEGRYMGLGRPADPEHIGDTFLWMKRSEKGPNSFSQTIRDLEPGRLYSMKMYSCDYQDLVNPKAKKQAEAVPFIGSVVLEGVELDAKRSFTEAYSSEPEPKIPVWITYHWKVFRAKGRTAEVTVSDWPKPKQPELGFGQEQTFNFLEIQPYHE